MIEVGTKNEERRFDPSCPDPSLHASGTGLIGTPMPQAAERNKVIRTNTSRYHPSDHAGAARRIAAHANAARLEPILWILGVDEKAAVVKGASAIDPAEWYARVTAEFSDAWAPKYLS